MIIQCEQCQTKFKLDDSRVADKSIKVRCARCKHVFSVTGKPGLPNDSASFEQKIPVFQIEEDLEVSAALAKEPGLNFEPVRTKEGEFGGLDFSGDDMFGDVVSTPPNEAASDSKSFDVRMDGFADSMGVESGAASHSTSFATQNPAIDNTFSLDDINLDAELASVAVQHVSHEDLKSSQDLLFAPLATTETKPVLDSTIEPIEKIETSPVQEELPPLSIASRRKESPRIISILVFVGLIIAGLLAFYNYWGTMDQTDKGKGKINQETGRITVRSVEASFIKNKQTGDLLVISGEAVNEFSKARAAIQIKGIVFGADGKEISSKTAFCGNRLSEEQLTNMPMDKIESVMGNQFGDSLTNMEVAPGKAIPFMIVIPKPPDGSKDYGVEPIGSTVATSKEK